MFSTLKMFYPWLVELCNEESTDTKGELYLLKVTFYYDDLHRCRFASCASPISSLCAKIPLLRSSQGATVLAMELFLWVSWLLRVLFSNKTGLFGLLGEWACRGGPWLSVEVFVLPVGGNTTCQNTASTCLGSCCTDGAWSLSGPLLMDPSQSCHLLSQE